MADGVGTIPLMPINEGTIKGIMTGTIVVDITEITIITVLTEIVRIVMDIVLLQEEALQVSTGQNFPLLIDAQLPQPLQQELRDAMTI